MQARRHITPPPLALASNSGNHAHPLSQDVNLDKGSIDTVPDQLRAALHKRRLRVIDIFRQFDDSGDGKVDGIEFLKAMRELGLRAPEESVAAVFVRRRLCHSRHVQARTR